MTGKADVSVRLWGSNSLTTAASWVSLDSEVVDDTIHLSFPGGLQLWNLKNEKKYLETHIYKGPHGNTLVVCRLVSVYIFVAKKGSLVVLSFDAVSGSFALAAERKARLFAKMSPATKVTMRLLKLGRLFTKREPFHPWFKKPHPVLSVWMFLRLFFCIGGCYY